MNNTLKKSAQLFALLLSFGLMAGCGAERDEPFDPDTDTDDDETGASVIDDELESKDQKLTNKVISYKNKRLQVFNDQTEFSNEIDDYSDTNFDLDNFDQSFQDGQVVLIDLGEIDSCEDHLVYKDLSAREDGDNGVKVSIEYDEVSGVDSTTCTITRPYRVFYIDSTGPLVFAEDIE